MAETIDKSNENKKEIDSILDQIHENSGPLKPNPRPDEDDSDIIKKPRGLAEEPEDLEGLLEKISEAPPQKSTRKQGFWQRLLSFFR